MRSTTHDCTDRWKDCQVCTELGLRIRERAAIAAHELLIKARPPRGAAPDIVLKDDSGTTIVDDYWNRHTLHTWRFASARESERYLLRRNAMYPKFVDLMDLYGDHTDETVLDYGCGPGDDVTGFLLWSKAARVVGVDVSGKALSQLRHRLAVHQFPLARIELIRISDSSARIPIGDSSIDWLHCGGVLHHTTHPQAIVAEFYRVMKHGAEGRLMLYNRDSVMYHLWLPYKRMIVDHAFQDLTVDQAFTRSTDGPDCPVSDAWAPENVLDMLRTAGLEASFRGGYPSLEEVGWFKKYLRAALETPAFTGEHREFVSELTTDEAGLPKWRGKYAGIGGVYAIRKPL